MVVKIIQEEKMHNAVALDEFRIEKELLIRLDHPNVIEILGAGDAGSPETPRPFLILERLLDFCKAIELDEPMSMMRRRAVSYTGLLSMARDLADGLNYLHTVHSEAMIIHRDIKPENLGMSHDGRLKLFDFGLCTCVKVRTTSRESYKMTGGTGSLRYMAPEVTTSHSF